MSKIFVIVGPTGVGKTELSIALAKKYNASVINADATQVYKDVNVGVAKISKDEMQGIPHFMIDVVNLDEEYTVADYQRDARKILDNLIKENKNVIIVGGSGLYIKALLYDYRFTNEDKKESNFQSYTNEELKEKVDSIYKDNNIHVNNRKRLERFLEHYNNTGEIIMNNDFKDKPLYDFVMIGLTTDRESLNNHLSLRINDMLMKGLIEEANVLSEYLKIYTFIGYKEVLDYSQKKIGLKEAIKMIESRTRNYAKRQYTWFKNQFDNITWFNTDYRNFDNTIKEVIDYLESL